MATNDPGWLLRHPAIRPHSAEVKLGHVVIDEHATAHTSRFCGHIAWTGSPRPQESMISVSEGYAWCVECFSDDCRYPTTVVSAAARTSIAAYETGDPVLAGAALSYLRWVAANTANDGHWSATRPGAVDRTLTTASTVWFCTRLMLKHHTRQPLPVAEVHARKILQYAAADLVKVSADGQVTYQGEELPVHVTPTAPTGGPDRRGDPTAWFAPAELDAVVETLSARFDEPVTVTFDTMNLMSGAEPVDDRLRMSFGAIAQHHGAFSIQRGGARASLVVAGTVPGVVGQWLKTITPGATVTDVSVDTVGAQLALELITDGGFTHHDAIKTAAAAA